MTKRKSIYIEDKVLTSILKRAELIVDGKELQEEIRKVTTNPRSSEVDKKCHRIEICMNESGLVKVVGNGTNDFVVERIAMLHFPEENTAEK